MEFTIIDGVVAGVIIISAILAYSRGFVREALAIGGWIVAAVVAFIFAPDAAPLIQEIPYVGDFVRDSCELGIIGAFAIVAVIALIVMSLFTPMFSGMIQRSAVGGVDAGLGFLFGVARGVLLVVVALIVYERLVGDERIEMVDNSRTVEILGQLQLQIEDAIPEDVPGWFEARFAELTSECDDTPAAPVEAETPQTDG